MITDVATNRLQRDTDRILGGIQARTATRPVLVVLVGLPGTGKTHLAGGLSRRTGAAVLESDAVRSLLAGERRYTRAENNRVFAALHAAIDALLGRPAHVIVDATSLTERDREPLYALAERNSAKLLLVHLTAPEAVARDRLARRKDETTTSDAGIEVYSRMQWRLEEIRRPHLTIDTSKDITPALDALAKEIQQ
jgi:hypothetical protein